MSYLNAIEDVTLLDSRVDPLDLHDDKGRSIALQLSIYKRVATHAASGDVVLEHQWIGTSYGYQFRHVRNGALFGNAYDIIYHHTEAEARRVGEGALERAKARLTSQYTYDHLARRTLGG